MGIKESNARLMMSIPTTLVTTEQKKRIRARIEAMSNSRTGMNMQSYVLKKSPQNTLPELHIDQQ